MRAGAGWRPDPDARMSGDGGATSDGLTEENSAARTVGVVWLATRTSLYLPATVPGRDGGAGW